MRRLTLLLVSCALAACGPTQAQPGGSSGSSSTTGGQRAPCDSTRDCALGICGTDHFCEAQCSSDGDCGSGNYCNERAQCVPRPAVTIGGSGASSGAAAASTTSTAGSSGGRSSSSTGAGSTSGTSSSTTAAATTTAGSTGGRSSSSAASTTGGATTAASTTGTTSGNTTGTTTGTTTGGTRCVSGSCPQGTACDFASGQCVSAAPGSGAMGATCSTSADCASGYCQIFGNGRHCTASCSASRQCPAGFVCRSQAGADPASYPDGLGVCVDATVIYGSGYTLGSATVGDSCSTTTSTHDDCHSIYPCFGGTCTDSCARDSDCGVAGWICVAFGTPRETYCGQDPGGNGTLGTSCPDDGYCKSGICHQGSSRNYCSQSCCSDSDCTALGGTTCLPQLDSDGAVYRACVDISANAATSLGGSCDPRNSPTCVSGYCMPFDPTNANATTGYCSTTCCTDADCSVVANSHCILEDTHLRWSDGGWVGYMGVCVKR